MLAGLGIAGLQLWDRIRIIWLLLQPTKPLHKGIFTHLQTHLITPTSRVRDSPHNTYFMVSLYTQQTVKVRARDIDLPDLIGTLVMLSRFVDFICWCFSWVIRSSTIVYVTFEHEIRLLSSVDHWSVATVMFLVARYVPIVWIVNDVCDERYYSFLATL
jgi:hypothetical protein